VNNPRRKRRRGVERDDRKSQVVKSRRRPKRIGLRRKRRSPHIKARRKWPRRREKGGAHLSSPGTILEKSSERWFKSGKSGKNRREGKATDEGEKKMETRLLRKKKDMRRQGQTAKRIVAEKYHT